MAVQNIVQLFVSAAATHANRVAFMEGGRQITYSELQQQVHATAGYFLKRGIGKWDKVLVFIPMRTSLYVTVLALLYIGACPVFLDEWVSISRLKTCLKTVPCKAIVAERKFLFISWFIGPLLKLKKIYPAGYKSTQGLLVPVEIKPDDTALITFTTGSTGTPKAANRTHHFLAMQQAALQPLLSGNFQTTLTLLPVVVLLNLSLGKTNVLPVKKINVTNAASVRTALQLIRQYAIESIIASPAITVAIAKRYLHENYFSTVKHIITGGGPIFPDDAQYIIQAFPQAMAMGIYGSTEAEPISTIDMKALINTNANTIQGKGLPVGKLHTDINIAVIPFTTAPIPNQSSAEWKQRKLQAGNSGEIVVSGPHVLRAYLNNDAAQQQNKFFVDEVLWHRTGDEGLLDESNHLYFRGRCTEVIHYMGNIIYPLISTWLLKQKLPIHEAAMLMWSNELLLVIDQKDKVLHHQLTAAINNTPLKNASIRYLPFIPKDKRHHTKIDYEKLQQALR